MVIADRHHQRDRGLQGGGVARVLASRVVRLRPLRPWRRPHHTKSPRRPAALAKPMPPSPHAHVLAPHPHMPMCWRPILTCPCVGAPSSYAHVLAPHPHMPMCWRPINPSGRALPSPDHLPTISRPSPDGAPAGAEWRPSSLPPCRSSMSPRVSSASAAAFVRASRLRDGRMPYLGPRSLFMTDRLCSSRRSSAQRS